MPGRAAVLRAVPGRELAAAIDAVRFAVGMDPALPMLGGVWFEVDGDALRLIATDRYRMAVARVDGGRPAGSAGPAGSAPQAVLAPVGFVDEARALLAGGDTATVVLDSGAIGVRYRDREVTGVPLDHDPPDYRRLLREATGGPDRRRVAVDVAGLRERLHTAGARTVVRPQGGIRCLVSVLTVDPGNVLGVSAADAPGGPDLSQVGVNREFLLDALDAAGSGQPVLELDGPIRPLALRRPDDDRAFSILMPVQL